MARAGNRVELEHCADPYTKLKPGERGTVSFVDDFGTVHVKWDSGSTLGMVEMAGDRFHVVNEEANYG